MAVLPMLPSSNSVEKYFQVLSIVFVYEKFDLYSSTTRRSKHSDNEQSLEAR